MTRAKKAVIFGAGNIGRGFLGQLFTESGYEVVFVEINRRLVDCLNQQGSYTLRMVNNELSQDLTIAHVRAMDGRDEKAVTREIVAADLLATAVGVRALPQVAPVIALGVARRAEADVGTPLNVIICENLKNASQVLRGMVQEHLPREHYGYLEEKVGFVEAVIARMVPILPDEVREKDPTFVVVEPYKVLPVDKRGFKGAIPDIVGLEPREDFTAYVDRKLYLHNAGHAMLGYLGYQKGLKYGYEALGDSQIRPFLDRALDEAAQALVAEHGFHPQALRAHIADILARSANRPLGDTVFRLARDPIRKLGPTDRLVGGARLALKHGIEPDALSWGIAAGLAFDHPRDPQASRLQEMLREQGVDTVLAGVCGLDPAGPLAEMVRERYGRVVRGDILADGRWQIADNRWRTIGHQLSAISYQPSARIVTVNLNPVLDRTLALPHLTVGQINRARLVRLDVGGKGFNVSRALLELGTPSLALGVLGGATGEMLRRGLEELGIAGEFVFVEGETRQNLTMLDESTGLYTKINEAGPQWSQDTVESLLAKVRKHVAPGDAWVMAGRLPPGAPPDLYARLITLVQSGGARAYLDSSDEPLRLACQAAPYGIKPNVEEAEEVVGHRLASLDDLVGATRVFLDFGIQVVAISRGAQGALVSQGRRVVQAMPPSVEIRSTVGAGDAFMAGLVWALEGGRDLAEAARWAVACGTAAAMEEGTGIGTREKFEALASQIVVEEM